MDADDSNPNENEGRETGEMSEGAMEEEEPEEEELLERLLPEESEAAEVLIALIDTGVEIQHPAISNSIVGGWNFIDNTDIVYDANQPMQSAHGTHIAGIIAQNSNDNMKIMPLQVFGPYGAYTSDIIAAIIYAEEHGARIANCSFGSGQNNQALREAIENSNMLFSVAVGNGRSNLDEAPENSNYSISMSNGSDSQASEKSLTEIDYSQYVNKIWVVKEWHNGAYTYPSSFFITHIENEEISGKLSTHEVAYPEFFSYSLEPNIYLADLNEVIENNTAECQFSDKDGDTGSIKLEFKDNIEIAATINYDTINFMDKEQYYVHLNEMYGNTQSGKEYLSKLAPMTGNYVFKPHKLADWTADIDNNKTMTYKTELNSWGKVNFVTVWVTGNKPYPTAFLANEYNDILYKFGEPFQVGSEIIGISIEDINNDGLKDIKLIAGFVDYQTGLVGPISEHIKWIFYQMDNGLFYDSGLDMK